jgi:hypothetical protein
MPFKLGLGAALEAAVYEAGPPMGTRVAGLAELDTRIHEAEASHTALVDEAGALGIPLALLPDEHARRMQAQHRREYVDANNSLNRTAIARGRLKAMQ